MNPHLETEVTWRGVRGPSLHAVVGAEPAALDGEGVRMAFGEVPADGATCIAGARWSWLGTEVGEAGSLRESLERACARLPVGRVALALSGGVDSAVLAGLLGARAVAYTLAPDLPGYSEEEQAREVAGRLGLEWRRVPVCESDFVEVLPEAIAACACPLYNLHPVSRYLLARAARADGFDCLVTGDGADEVHRGTSGADYLPIVGAMTRAAGLVAVAPFLDASVVASAPRDPDKQALRALAHALAVPTSVAGAPKRPRLAPAMDVSRRCDRDRVQALARCLGRDDADASVAWTTLALFTRGFPGLACVA